MATLIRLPYPRINRYKQHLLHDINILSKTKELFYMSNLRSDTKRLNELVRISLGIESSLH